MRCRERADRHVRRGLREAAGWLRRLGHVRTEVELVAPAQVVARVERVVREAGGRVGRDHEPTGRTPDRAGCVPVDGRRRQGAGAGRREHEHHCHHEVTELVLFHFLSSSAIARPAVPPPRTGGPRGRRRGTTGGPRALHGVASTTTGSPRSTPLTPNGSSRAQSMRSRVKKTGDRPTASDWGRMGGGSGSGGGGASRGAQTTRGTPRRGR